MKFVTLLLSLFLASTILSHRTFANTPCDPNWAYTITPYNTNSGYGDPQEGIPLDASLSRQSQGQYIDSIALELKLIGQNSLYVEVRKENPRNGLEAKWVLLGEIVGLNRWPVYGDQCFEVKLANATELQATAYRKSGIESYSDILGFPHFRKVIRHGHKVVLKTEKKKFKFKAAGGHSYP